MRDGPASPLRLLIVDDNPINQKILERALFRLGFRSDISGNGREAVEAVQRQPYALVLMDCMMPVMDGFEATRQIRALGGPNGKVPIVAFTADTTSGTRERCFDAGMDDYLSKPLDFAALQGTLGRWLGEAAAV